MMARADQATSKPAEFDTELAHFTPRQRDALKALDSGRIKFLLYGGALGGGKSFFLRWYGVRRLLALFQMWGIRGAVGMLACEDYPSLKDRQLTKIGQEFEPWLGKLHEDHKLYGRCFVLNDKWGSGVLCFRNLDDPSKYASAEFAFILVDELTKNDLDVFTFLRTRLRWPGLPDVECQFVAGSNPGSVGHAWVKQLWMDRNFPREFWDGGTDYRPMFKYIRSKAMDNPYLDSNYWAILDTLPPTLRKAFRDGNWDIFAGQAFPHITRESHMVPDMPIPDAAPLYMTYDWGFGKPFSIGWWWLDADGRAYRFMAWYGWNGEPDHGIAMADSDIRKGIVSREKDAGIWGKRITRIAGPDCFAKRPDTRGGGYGPPTAEIFAQGGDPVHLIPGDADRITKIRQFREWTKVYDDRRPMMVCYQSCADHFFRTLCALPIDEAHPEDVDTKAEDHLYDEICFLCLARPLSYHIPPERMAPHAVRIDALEKGLGNPYQEWERMEWETQRDGGGDPYRPRFTSDVDRADRILRGIVEEQDELW